MAAAAQQAHQLLSCGGSHSSPQLEGSLVVLKGVQGRPYVYSEKRLLKRW